MNFARKSEIQLSEFFLEIFWFPMTFTELHLPGFWRQIEAIILVSVSLIFILGWKLLMPAINKFRDAALEGHEEAGTVFNFLHRLSVGINLAQLAAVVVVFIKIIPLFNK